VNAGGLLPIALGQVVSASDDRDVVAEHAELIGRVAIAWNELSIMLSMLFELLSGMPSLKAREIYFTPASDSAQRNLLAAAAKVALKPHPDLLKEFNECMDGIRRLSSERNAAIHTSWAFQIPGNAFVPSPAVPTHKALKPDFVLQFQSLKTELNNKWFQLNEIRKKIAKLGPL
jgi:hypothetical protein